MTARAAFQFSTHIEKQHRENSLQKQVSHAALDKRLLKQNHFNTNDLRTAEPSSNSRSWYSNKITRTLLVPPTTIWYNETVQVR